MMIKRWIVCAAVLIPLSVTGKTSAADWPMWRAGAGRWAATDQELADKLHLAWVRELPAPLPAWPKTQSKLQFDLVPQPVVAGGLMFVPSTVHDSVTAYRTSTGAEVWQFTAGGPVRFAPAVHRGKVFFTSDDGHLYAVDAATGELQWKVRGGPEDRWVIGNHRLTSSWPARGGPVVHDGKVYFAASIWPFMGIFIHAVDAQTGETVWTNSGDGTNFTIHPHGAGSFGTVVPQGHLAVEGEHLIVPGGRSTPAVYDAQTGKLLAFHYASKHGGHEVMAAGGKFYVGGRAFRSSDGRQISGGAPQIIGRQMMLTISGQTVRAVSSDSRERKVVSRDRRGRETTKTTAAHRPLFQFKATGPIGPVAIQAGSKLITARGSQIAAYRLKQLEGDAGEQGPVWTGQVMGEVWDLVAADDRLLAVTTDARVYCFAERGGQVTKHPLETRRLRHQDDRWGKLLGRMLKQGAATEGYCLALGIGSGRLIEELLLRTDLYVIAVDPDERKVDTLRARLQQAGLYGRRVSVHHGQPAQFKFPPYLAELVVSENLYIAGFGERKAFVQTVYEALRPYGGTACFELSDNVHDAFAATVEEAKLPQAKLHRTELLTRLVRPGPLPGAGQWTHQNGNAAQTLVSKDSRVKVPLGVLWFGGPSHEGILPRHGHGPSPQVAGGRLVIEGADMLRCTDVYTGRVLWEKSLPGIGDYYNTTAHFAGAGEIGSNYVTLADRVYVVYGEKLLELDAATGETTFQFTLPKKDDEVQFWGHVTVTDDVIIAAAHPIDASAGGRRRGPPPKPVVHESTIEVIKPHAVWKFHYGSDPVAAWNTADFDDGRWRAGPAGLGYGDGDDRTKLDLRGKHRRAYIRKTFDGKSLGGASKLALMLNFDDAFIAYLNGKEIARSGVGRGSGAQAKDIDSHEAGAYVRFDIKNWKSLIQDGQNVLAIEGHNVSLRSSDFTLDPYLIAVKQQTAKQPEEDLKPVDLPQTRYSAASRRLIVFDRKSRERLWTRTARQSFRHNNICAGAGKVFCIDGMTPQRLRTLARRGIDLQGTATLYALDAHSGHIVWQADENVRGTFLNYSAEHDTLLEAGSAYRDRARDEHQAGMVAYRGTDGKVLWRNTESHGGPCLLWNDEVITNGGGGFALSIKTGKRTGWKYVRQYGCNTAVGSEHLLTFRSGAAGYYDLASGSGTGNIGGFRSSCTNNLIVADGVLNAPDYTRTCTCAYQNQTSLALIHMPEADYWTYGGFYNAKRKGLNLAAPGERRSKQGTLWVANYKAMGVEIAGDAIKQFRQHSSQVTAGPLPWVASSGVRGVKRISLSAADGKKFTVRLIFLEPEETQPGDRVLSVTVAGKQVADDLDIAKEVGGSWRAIERTVTGVQPTGGKLHIDLQSKSKLPTVISGIEWVEE